MKKLVYIIAALLLLFPGGLTAQPSGQKAAKTNQQQSVLETMLIGAVAKMQTGDYTTAIGHLE